MENLKKELTEWVDRVLYCKATESESRFISTYHIMKDVDKIIADAFDRDCFFEQD